METANDPFQLLGSVELEDFADLTRRPCASPTSPSMPQTGVAVARFAGFDLQDRPLVAGIALLPGQVVAARSLVAMRQAMLDAQVAVLFEAGDPGLPIIVGVLQDRPETQLTLRVPGNATQAQVDGDHVVISAEREIVLRCGDASITLTRAGKVIIKGNYIISRSTGYNKIKGAAVDIN